MPEERQCGENPPTYVPGMFGSMFGTWLILFVGVYLRGRKLPSVSKTVSTFS